MILRNNFAETAHSLSMIFNRSDRYSFAYWFLVKSLIRIENHLHGYHRNRTEHKVSAHIQQWNSRFRKHLALFYQYYGLQTFWSLTLSISLQDFGLHAWVQEANTWRGSADGGLGWVQTDHCWEGDRPVEVTLGLQQG